jgi:hypothetical protein
MARRGVVTQHNGETWSMKQADSMVVWRDRRLAMSGDAIMLRERVGKLAANVDGNIGV